MRFLAVLVVATPCPLLIGIPVAIIGAISLAAKRSIIIRDPAVLERIDECRTIVLDKTGTLTYGEPTLTDRLPAPGMDDALVAAVRRERGTILEASVGQTHPRRGGAGASCAARRERGS